MYFECVVYRAGMSLVALTACLCCWSCPTAERSWWALALTPNCPPPKNRHPIYYRIYGLPLSLKWSLISLKFPASSCDCPRSIHILTFKTVIAKNSQGYHGETAMPPNLEPQTPKTFCLHSLSLTTSSTPVLLMPEPQYFDLICPHLKMFVWSVYSVQVLENLNVVKTLWVCFECAPTYLSRGF